MRLRLSILISLALGLASSAFCADDSVAFQLVPDVKVDGSGIFLDQLVTLTTSSSVVPPSNVVLPHLRLAAAPTLGQAVPFTRAQVIELAKKDVPELDSTNWSGPARVRVARRTKPLSDADMLSLLTSALQRDEVKDRGELELHLARPLPPTLIPAEGVTVKITELPASGIGPSFYLRCELWHESEHVSDWQLGLTARVWREIPIATERLLRGQLLKNANVQLERRDVLIFRDAFLNYPNFDPSLELTETVSADMPVLNRSVRIRPAVTRGKIVDGLYQDGALVISLKVESLEDGLAGQTIRVRNPKTKREVFGKVQNEQTVLISL